MRVTGCDLGTKQAHSRTSPFSQSQLRAERARWPPSGASPPTVTSRRRERTTSDFLGHVLLASPQLRPPPLAARRRALAAQSDPHSVPADRPHDEAASRYVVDGRAWMV
jgi:hypothetical protein